MCHTIFVITLKPPFCPKTILLSLHKFHNISTYQIKVTHGVLYKVLLDLAGIGERLAYLTPERLLSNPSRARSKKSAGAA